MWNKYFVLVRYKCYRIMDSMERPILIFFMQWFVLYDMICLLIMVNSFKTKGKGILGYLLYVILL